MDLVQFPQIDLYDLEAQMIAEEPEGFFPVDRTSNWGAFRYVISSILQELVEQLELIEQETDVNGATSYLADWERMLGLLENPTSETVQDRRAAILDALNQTGFTRTRLRNLIEGYLTSSAAGDPPQLTPSGIPLTGSGVPLYSGIASVEDAYTIWEDVENYEYTIRLDSAVTLPGTANRAIEKLTPGGITHNITYHAEPQFTSNLFSQPQMDSLPTDGETDNAGWEELSTEQVYVGTNSLKIHPRDIDGAGGLVFRITNKTLANSVCGVKFKVWLPKNVWPTHSIFHLAGEDFTNNVIYPSQVIDPALTEEWQEVEGYWTPGADFTGSIRLQYDGNYVPGGMGSYLTDHGMEDAGVAAWATGGTNTRAKITTSPTPWRQTQALEVTYQDNDFLAYQSLTLAEDDALGNQIYLARVYIPSAHSPTQVRLSCRDFAGITGENFGANADLNITDAWQTVKLEWTPPEDTVNDRTGIFMLSAAGLSAGNKIIFDSCSANNDDELYMYIDDVECGVLG